MDTAAFGHAAPEAVNRASPRPRLPVSSSPLSSPLLSWAMMETDCTSAPLAPGGLELAVTLSWLAWGIDFNAAATSSADTAFDALIPPPAAAVGLNRGSRPATIVASTVTADAG